MELEGLGCSLVGRALYCFCNEQTSWIPWEFISGSPYACRILVCGSGVDTLELEHDWTFVVRPSGSGKEWSCLATIIKGMSQGLGVTGSVLIVFGVGAPKAPPGFLTFMDMVLGEGRTLLTRVWLGEHIEIPAIPDAIFFPLGVPAHTMYDMIHRLPARGGHEGFTMTGDWSLIVKATSEQGLGLVVSDIGESRWSLFWHKIADSDTETDTNRFRKGMRLLRLGTHTMERCSLMV
jgi:hypothetical protein